MTPRLRSAPSMIDPVSGMRVWLFDDDATLVTLPAGPMNKAAAQFLTQQVDVQIQSWLLTGIKGRFIHDWRACVAYEPAARELIIEWGRRWRSNHREVLLQLSDEASPFMRIAVTTGMAALRLMGMHVQLLKDLGPVYATLDAKTPRTI